jgi:SSS family solute:Na+ symporter
LNAALIIILSTVIVSAAVGVYAGSRVKMNLENWTVGGRRFGVLLIWLLMAGEIYTTFTFLGASGWAYSRGAPTFYIMIYGTLAYAVSFFVLPAVWKVGKRFGLHTQPDFFFVTYRNRGLGVLVALVGVASIIPYLQLQLQGLGLIVEVASEGAIRSGPAIVLSFLLTCAFVFTSGIRGTAWVAVIKDIMMIAAVAIVGIGVPHIYFGGFGKMFQALLEKHPGYLTFPGASPGMGTLWVMSTALLTGLGFYMWPHAFGSAFSAKSSLTIKRNSVIMPFYQIPILLVFMVGFTALLVLPGLKNGDMAFLELVHKTYPPWFMGFIGAAGAVTAMVPASLLVLFAATLLVKNVYQAAFAPSADEKKILRLSRLMVLAIMAAALIFALRFPKALVNLLLIGYDGVSQFFPGVVLGLFWKRTSGAAVLAGLATGIGMAMVLVFGKHDPFLGMNAGFVALLANTLVTFVLSLLVGRKETATLGGSAGRSGWEPGVS